MSSPENNRHSRTGYRIAFVLTAFVVLAVVVTLPFSVVSIVDDLGGSAGGKVIPVLTGSPATERLDHSRVHLAFVALDETGLRATLRISGHYVCKAHCDWKHRLVFVSAAADDADAEGMPPSATITLPSPGEAFSQTFDLPIRGHPIHYPFDRYDLLLGVAAEWVHPDGTLDAVPPSEAANQLFLTIQELLPRQTMTPPANVDPESIRSDADPLHYLTALTISFERPRYVRVLAVLLVLLIAAAAAYSVFLRPLQDLFVNSGALVLGVWGIRGIVVPGNMYYITAMDMALSMVIIFLLGAITVRTLMFLHERSELRVLNRQRTKDDDARPPAH
jgi:hypothetical protein